jgi:hypothetical protein
VQDNYKFNVAGSKDATVADLRKGMRVSAQKIVEEPRTEIASNTVVTGQAPPPPTPRAVVAQASPAPTRNQGVAQARPAVTPTPAPAPVEVAQAQPAPTRLPTTASKLPLALFLGLLFTAVGLSLRRSGQTRKV